MNFTSQQIEMENRCKSSNVSSRLLCIQGVNGRKKSFRVWYNSSFEATIPCWISHGDT